MFSIGIVILNYNGSKDTVECIKSINEAAKKADIVTHICVVDNGSESKDVENLMAHKENLNFSLLTLNDNLGYSRACNKGISFLKKNFSYLENFIISNNDLIYDHNFFVELVKRDLSNKIFGPLILCWPEKDIIWSAGGKLNFLTGRGEHFFMGKNINNVGKLFTTSRSFLSGACLIVNKAVFDKIGLLPEEYFFGGEEWEFSHKANKNNIELVFDPLLKVYHKVDLRYLHGNSHDYLNPKFVSNGIIIKYVFINRCANLIWRFIWKQIYTIYLKLNYIYNPRKIKRIALSYQKNVDISMFKLAVKEALKFRSSSSYSKEDIERLNNILNTGGGE